MIENKLDLIMREYSYDDYISGFRVFSTYKEARQKGFEAHHILPVSIQKREMGKVYDDRCIRCTITEHIVAHFLLAKERGGLYLSMFYLFFKMAEKKMPENKFIDYVNIKEIEEVGKILEQGKTLYSLSQKELWDDVRKQEHSSKVKEWYRTHTNPNLGRKMSAEIIQKALQTRKENEMKMSDNERKKKKDLQIERILESRPAGWHHSQAAKDKVSKGNKGRISYINESHTKEIHLKPGEPIPAGFSKGSLRKGRPSKLKGKKMSEEFKEKIRKAAANRAPWTDQMKEKLSKTLKDQYKTRTVWNKGLKYKLKNPRKVNEEAMTKSAENVRNRSLIYKYLKESKKYEGRWNDFQIWFKENNLKIEDYSFLFKD